VSSEKTIMRSPSRYDLEDSTLAKYMAFLGKEFGKSFECYQDLHRWSVENLNQFWMSIWKFTEVISQDTPHEAILEEKMPGAEWFPGARLNFAENLLKASKWPDASERVAIVSRCEGRAEISLTYQDLYTQVASVQKTLKEMGVGAGDRVAGIVCNTHEAVVAMLAAASIGAIWSSASPDFGVNTIYDRFSQIEPKVLFSVNGYRYGGKAFSRLSEIEDLASRIPSIQNIIVININNEFGVPDDETVTLWDNVVRVKNPDVTFEAFPFNHPVYILYSSGTTGKPKCITHSAGGALLQHSKEHFVHFDVQKDDCFCFFTTCGWMVWNWMVSTLASGCRVVLFDGNPAYPDTQTLWDLVETQKVTHFGTSPKFLGICRNLGLEPKANYQFESLRSIVTSGSPLLPEDFDWVYASVKDDVWLSSVSGGTDIVSCFVGGVNILPVTRGEIQNKLLGMDVYAFDDSGNPVVNEPGELVCCKPSPSMPVGFWNDENDAKYLDAYFSQFEGVWAHGDLIEFSDGGSCRILGRSDSTLNPGGVRIGTSEIYRHVESLDEVKDSLAFGVNVDGDSEIMLLVVLNDGFEFTEELVGKIKHSLRANASPRHVPRFMYSVTDIPYTRTGKKMEVAVAKMFRGQKLDNVGAMANPEAMDEVRRIEQSFRCN